MGFCFCFIVFILQSIEGVNPFSVSSLYRNLIFLLFIDNLWIDLDFQYSDSSLFQLLIRENKKKTNGIGVSW